MMSLINFLKPSLQISQSEKKNKRSPLFDVLKIVAMSYVVIGHVLQRWYLVGFTETFGFTFFYSVSLSLFFFVGGYFVTRCRTFSELLKYLAKLVLSYLVPAFLFTCLSIWLLPRFADHDFAFWMGELYYRTDTFYWFFLTAFFLNAALAIFQYLAYLFLKEKSLLNDVLSTVFMTISLLLFSSIFIYIYNAPDLGPGTLSANMFLYYLPITFMGFLVQTFGKHLENWRYINFLRVGLFIGALILYSLALWRYSNWLDGLKGSFNDISGRSIGSLAGVIAYFYLSMFIQRFAIIQKVSKYAKYSGPFYLVHVFLIRLLASYLLRPTVFDSSAMLFIILLTIGFYFGALLMTILLVEFPLTDFLLFGNLKSMKKMFTLFKQNRQVSN